MYEFYYKSMTFEFLFTLEVIQNGMEHNPSVYISYSSWYIEYSFSLCTCNCPEK
jgi:hypothetical protein